MTTPPHSMPQHSSAMPAAKRPLTPAVQATLDRVTAQLQARDRPALATLFRQAFPNTIQTTLEALPDDRTFVYTGDIPAMWLRDSAAQVSPYVPLCREDPELRALIAGVIRQQAHLIALDPYANAFNLTPRDETDAEYSFDQPPPGPWVWERKFELDSLCAPLLLAWNFWRATGDADALGDLRPMIGTVLSVMETEQDHAGSSRYRFERPAEYCVLPSDTLPRNGQGAECAPTGLIWSGFRPSDDACTYPYLVPANIMAVMALRRTAGLALELYGDSALAHRATSLEQQIEAGLETHAVVQHEEYGEVWAYEVDGLGNALLMDDANVPSLLSLPYLGYCRADDERYLNTRRLLLSAANPSYYRGTYAAGIGSPHTPGRRVWPISLCIEALTAGLDTAAGRAHAWELLETLAATTAGTYLMHESFDPDQPATFTRPWFAWANSLLAETVLTVLATEEEAPQVSRQS
ncbi:glycoside hydrolase family 125 protein (plasmid) [Deinococcus sp. KNUC1210]|uniref:glycoside hydrolase family 125 protein n=1 Tax=Deinococcus sp. KNUC1210 TaxID=2917691 RepID=UPI001EEFC117|nr:glycoside hydrolase family 125 protein [Deinococcus sp. KNUC1210]ULH17072.1 glycoside hydrolase family 125 protein [Deinococcus sp. KNUC1210]